MLYKWLPIQSSKHKWAPKTYTHTVAMLPTLVVPYLGKKQIQTVQTYDLEQFYACLLYTSGVAALFLAEEGFHVLLCGAEFTQFDLRFLVAVSYTHLTRAGSRSFTVIRICLRQKPSLSS